MAKQTHTWFTFMPAKLNGARVDTHLLVWALRKENKSNEQLSKRPRCLKHGSPELKGGLAKQTQKKYGDTQLNTIDFTYILIFSIYIYIQCSVS